MSAPQTYGASLYDLAKDEGMSRDTQRRFLGQGEQICFEFLKVTFGKA